MSDLKEAPANISDANLAKALFRRPEPEPADEQDDTEAEAGNEAEEAEADDDQDAGDQDDSAAEPEPDDDETAEDEDQDDEPKPAPRDAVVTLPGGETITVEEAAKGYLRQRDYTQKTMQVAEVRRQLQESLAQWAIQPEQEPDWSHLARTVPPEHFVAMQADWQMAQRRSEAAKQEYYRIAETARQEQVAAAFEAAREMIPELNDPKKARTVGPRIVAAARELGYQESELGDINDPRMVRGLYLIAQLLDQQRKEPVTAKRVATASQSLPTRARSGKTDPKVEAKQALSSFKRSQSNSDLERLIFRKR